MAFDPVRVRQALDNFGKDVIEGARQNLESRGMNASYKLSNSMSFQSVVSKNSISAFFYLGPYAMYQDQGVNGTEQARGSQFNFTTDKPSFAMVNRIEDWMASKGIGFEEVKARQKAYAISTNILRRGLDKTLFFTEAYERGFAMLPEELVEAFGLDIDDFFKFIIE